MTTPKERAVLGLPVRVFYYTVEQVGAIIEMKTEDVMKKVLWFEGREVGHKPASALCAINLARGEQKPEWRIEERELIRWMRWKKIRRFDRNA